MSVAHKQCLNCASVVPIEANFCPSCGHTFADQQQAPQPGPSGAAGSHAPPPPGYPPPTPGHPHYPPPPGWYPYPALPYTGKEKLAAGLLAILIGPLGIHHFYLGNTGWGVTFLLVTILTCGYGSIIIWPFSLIQGILYLTANDYDFQQK